MFDTEQMYCMVCEQSTYRKNKHKGSFLGELCFYIIVAIIAASTSWFLLIAPLGYTIYRYSSYEKVCQNCASSQIIPLNSPKAKRLIEQSDSNITAPSHESDYV